MQIPRFPMLALADWWRIVFTLSVLRAAASGREIKMENHDKATEPTKVLEIDLLRKMIASGKSVPSSRSTHWQAPSIKRLGERI